jgi:hypothetical protein
MGCHLGAKLIHLAAQLPEFIRAMGLGWHGQELGSGLVKLLPQLAPLCNGTHD